MRRYAAPPIQARAALLIDLDTGRTLYSKNADQRLPMASTTKITTAVLALQHARLNDLVRVSKRAAGVGESTMALTQGERVSVRQLLYGLMLNSGNDAAEALAEHIGGSERKFVAMMNALARSLGMSNTHYATPHGLDSRGHFTSARDLVTVTEYAMRDAVFRKIVSSAGYHVPATKHNREHWLANVNKVMYWYPGVDGIKPGDTDAAGLCQVVSVNRDGRHLLAVLLHTPTIVIDIRNLFNFGLQDFRWIQSPGWWDVPSGSLSGSNGKHAWVYYFGVGHYIEGLFLSYFNTHGGLKTFGYPRTEELRDRGQIVQYFQGGELAYDAAHRSVYPAKLGVEQARMFVPSLVQRHLPISVDRHFRRLYRKLGGRSVFGPPVTAKTNSLGYPVQFFLYGEIAQLRGSPYVVSVGDTALLLKHWLPAIGVSDQYSETMTPAIPRLGSRSHRKSSDSPARVLVPPVKNGGGHTRNA